MKLSHLRNWSIVIIRPFSRESGIIICWLLKLCISYLQGWRLTLISNVHKSFCNELAIFPWKWIMLWPWRLPKVSRLHVWYDFYNPVKAFLYLGAYFYMFPSIFIFCICTKNQVHQKIIRLYVVKKKKFLKEKKLQQKNLSKRIATLVAKKYDGYILCASNQNAFFGYLSVKCYIRG